MELLDLADAWCAIGNSTGTFAEVAMAWDYMVKEFLPQKPLLLIGSAWEGFVRSVESDEQFQPWLDLIEHCEGPEAAVERLIAIFGEQPRLPELEVIR